MSGTRDLRRGFLSTYPSVPLQHSRSALNLKNLNVTITSVHTAAGATDAGKATKAHTKVSVTDRSIIAVMGGTGSGKSSFIKGITGREDIVVGHTLHSETEEIRTYDVKHDGTSFVLADTPGFDDTNRSDFDVLHQISDWLKCNFDTGKRLTGIIYLHPINSTRLQGSSLRTMHLFKKLVGDGNHHNILLATTFWNLVTPQIGSRREKELGEIESMWKSMRDNGSKVERVGRDYDRFKVLLVQMSRKGGMKMQITEELNQGKTLEETMAGMALNDNAKRLKEVEDEYRRKLEERDRTREELREKRRQEAGAKLAEAQKAEQAFKEQQDARLIAQLKEAEKEHERRKKARENEIKENERQTRILQEQREKWRKREEERLIGDRLQGISKTHLRASEILKSNVESSIDMVRAMYAAGGTRVQVKGMSSRGIGFATVDAAGRRGSGWSVDRSSMNIWCDACLTPIGSRGVYRCTKCIPGRDLSYCKPCQADGYGCLDRSHTLIYDTRLIGNSCRRALNPAAGLDCSRLDCKKSIQGMYLHCCDCDKDDFDLCMECVLLKGRGCRNAMHDLKWQILPCALPEAILTELEKIAALGQLPIQKHYVFDNAEAKELCAFSKEQYDYLLNELGQIEDGVKGGQITAKIKEFIVPGWCDACMAPYGAHATYTCTEYHDPFPEGTGFMLCQTCYKSNRRCPGKDTHVLKAQPAEESTCTRQLEPPANHVTCDVASCKRDVKGIYAHCCTCNGDDMDICIDCLLQGWRCGDPEHVLSIFFTRPFGAPP